MLKIATWNVNSLRVRLPHLLDWLSHHQPDIMALQEIKMTDEQFPLAEIEAAGYHALFAGQKTYNGVALLSRIPGSDVITDLPNFNDPQRRFLGATYSQSPPRNPLLSKEGSGVVQKTLYDKLKILNVYVPNGASVGSEKYQYKLAWLNQLQDYLRDNLKQYPHLIVLGDFNIAPEDQDVHDPVAWAGKILVSPEERKALQNLLHLGLQDTFRLFEQPTGSFSWWDYRQGSFQRNHGVRIDLILASTALHCSACTIDMAPRRLERPSDHAPVVAIVGNG